MMTVMAMTMMMVKMVIFMLLMMKWDKAIVSLCVDNRRSILQNSERKYVDRNEKNWGDAPQKISLLLFLAFI